VSQARGLALDIAGRIEGLGPVSVKRFFGGTALTVNGVQFAFVMKGSLYLRVDEESRATFEARGAMPFTYASGSKTVTVASYYEAPAEIFDDVEELRGWATRAYRAAHPSQLRRRRRRGVRTGHPGP
jgi:DNA transformation protein and related proteins